jgi:type II secretory pathway pseudopilin PulG
VIAILAAVTIVTYNGIQRQAYNTKIISNVRNYQQVIEMYRATHEHYPATEREKNGEHIATACLGTGYANHRCGKVSGVIMKEDPDLMAELTKVSGGELPPVHDDTLPSDTESFVGAVYGIDITDATESGRARTIQYALHGDDVDCGLPDAYSYRLSDNPPVTACEIVLEPVE